jgi:hypothetical protein
VTPATKDASPQPPSFDYSQLASAITNATAQAAHANLSTQHEAKRRPSPLHYVVIAISVCQLIGLIWVGAGKLGTLITDQLATHTAVTEIARQVTEIKGQVADIKTQQDTDRKNVDAKLETFQYDIRDILVALAAKQIFTPSDNSRMGVQGGGGDPGNGAINRRNDLASRGDRRRP